MIRLWVKSKKKISILLLLALFSVTAFSGCSSGEKPAATVPAPTVKAIVDKIKQVTDISQMREGDTDTLKKFYSISADEVEEFSLYMPPSNIKAEEILVIKVKDKSGIPGIKDKIAKRVEKQKNSFKDYIPDEYFLVDKNVLKDKGNYILLAISKDAKKIETAFDELAR